MLDLSVENYRAVENGFLHIEGLVWITGPNSNGKSYFIKSIDAVMRNESGSALVYTGADHTEINLNFSSTDVFPALDIKWVKHLKGSGKYIINGKELTKTGRTTPQEILDSGLAFLSLKEKSFNLHIWDQATYFLVREPTTVIFQAISKLLKHQAFLPMLQQIKVDTKEQKDNLNDLGSQFKYFQKRKIDFEQQIQYFQPFESKRSLFDNLFESQKNLEQSQEDLNYLRSLNADIQNQKDQVQSFKIPVGRVRALSDDIVTYTENVQIYRDWEIELNDIEDIINQVDQSIVDFDMDSIPILKLMAKVSQFSEFQKYEQKMNQLNQEVKQCQETLDNLPSAVFELFDTLQSQYWVYNSAYQMSIDLISIQDDVSYYIEKVKTFTELLEQAQKDQDIFYKDNPLCPLCGQLWNRKEHANES